MSYEEDKLNVPPDVFEDKNSKEILRAWIANKSLQCSLLPDLWEDAGSWGVALADVARHVGNAIEAIEGIPAQETVAQIQNLFNAELGSPTDEPSGNFIQ